MEAEQVQTEAGVAPVTSMLDAAGRRRFRATLPYDGDTWARGRGWALWSGLGGIPYYRATFPEFAANARHTVQEILREAA